MSLPATTNVSGESCATTAPPTGFPVVGAGSFAIHVQSRSPICHWSNCAVIFQPPITRSEEHTSELQSLMRISYAVFCLKKKNQLYTLQLLLIKRIDPHTLNYSLCSLLY